MSTFRVVGPDPDDNYFIIEIVDGDERVLDETFRSRADALAAIEKLKDDRP